MAEKTRATSKKGTTSTKKGSKKGGKQGKDLNWLLKPPQGNNVHLFISTAKGAKLTPAVRKSLEDVIRKTHAESSSAKAQASAKCSPFFCNDGRCQPIVREPNCLFYRTCRVIETEVDTGSES